MFSSALVLKTFDQVRSTLQSVDVHLKVHRHRIKKFAPHVKIHIEKGDYIVKTAENGEQLEESLRLRFDIFHREYMNSKRRVGIDIDRLDFLCDHILIFSRTEKRVVGTYRLLSSHFVDKFYSEAEFSMNGLLQESGAKLELGRACIEKDHRNGVVINLLWRGIASYIAKTESKYLFGCASVKTLDVATAAMIYRYLASKRALDFNYGIVPTKKFRAATFNEKLTEVREFGGELSDDFMQEQIPALFQSYLKMGAKVGGEPAFDKDFHCIDFLTLLKVDEMNPLFLRRYVTG